MSALTEAIAQVLRAYGDTCTRANADYLAEQVVQLFTVEAFHMPEYDVEAVMGGQGDTSYGGQLMHYKGLKTVRRWMYTDG